MKVYVDPDPYIQNKIKYVLRLYSQNKNTPITFVNAEDKADRIVQATGYTDLNVSLKFYELLKQGTFDFRSHLGPDCVIRSEDHKPDYISTVFYMINSLQEYAQSNRDHLDRFTYASSYQCYFNTSTRNIVQECFNHIDENLNHLASTSKRASRVFLTHDIDSVHGALLQDSLHCLKRGMLKPILKIVWNAALSRPDWLNMDTIIKMESEYDLKSTFFWLVNRGRVKKGVDNSDYDIRDKKIRKMQLLIEKAGFTNGLHKSISVNSYGQELLKLNLGADSNRNHYLCMRLPQHYQDINDSEIKLDTTLGFADCHGFRNNYGLPFTPYSLEHDQPFSFVEVPLNIMDGTFHKYYKWPPAETAKEIGNFIERNRYDCIITILWHNTFFTQYKFGEYLKVYKALLETINDLGIRAITPQEIIDEYSLAS